jgi:TolA-binding protein
MNAFENIHNYIEKKLSPTDMETFKTALNQDPMLQQSLAEHKQLRYALEKKRAIIFYEEMSKNENIVSDSETQATIIEPKRVSFYAYYAIAASLVSIGLGIWWFTAKKASIENVVTHITTPRIDSSAPQLPSKTETITKNTPKSQEEKQSNQSIAFQMNEKEKALFDDFYNLQINAIQEGSLGVNKVTEVEKAKQNLKKGELKSAYTSFKILHDAYPKDDDITLYYALCLYKQNKIKEAINILSSIKENNPEVAALLEEMATI